MKMIYDGLNVFILNCDIYYLVYYLFVVLFEKRGGAIDPVYFYWIVS